MPSVLLTLASGSPFIIYSGNPYSGGAPVPTAGVQLKYANNASGNAYVSLSGGGTLNSGSFLFSGTIGLLDGMLLAPGDSYFVPRQACGLFSGTIRIYATCDPAASGQGRLYWEPL